MKHKPAKRSTALQQDDEDDDDDKEDRDYVEGEVGEDEEEYDEEKENRPSKRQKRAMVDDTIASSSDQPPVASQSDETPVDDTVASQSDDVGEKSHLAKGMSHDEMLQWREEGVVDVEHSFMYTQGIIGIVKRF